MTLLVAAILLEPLVATPLPAATSAGMPEGMVLHQLAFLKSGAEEGKYLDERRIQAMQEERLAWLGKLHADGRAVVSGPVWMGGDLRSVAALAVSSKDEAEELLRGDPFVRSGRLVAEVHPWWCDKNAFRKTADIVRMARTWLVLLERPASAPGYPAEELEKIQAGHMDNIHRMAASGDLFAAGPFGDDGVLRGIFVFRTAERDRVRSLVEADPAIKAGRLQATIVQWSIPEAAIP